MKQISVQVMPNTFILIDENIDPVEAKKNWLKKFYKSNKPLNEQQVRRERETIRGGRIMQRTKYKWLK